MDLRKALLIVGCIWCFCLPVQAQVIVNTEVPVSSVTSRFLLSVFSMKARYWPNGTAIKVFVLPDEHPDHVTFVKQTLGVFPYQLRKSWDRTVFSGAGLPPKVVQSPEEMMIRVQQTPGAIGYMKMDFQGGSDVTVLQINK